MRIRFLGAAREVTGSSFLVETPGLRFLVDCGMFQGGTDARSRNLADWPFDPRELDLVLLTHAHVDHSGLLPRLCAAGFSGPVWATTATVELLQSLLVDSARIQADDDDDSPLYSVAQARACLTQLRGVGYDEAIRPHPLLRCTFRDAGHILGSASLELRVDEGGRRRRVVFSGDLGQPGRPIVRDPTPIPEADVLVVEATYGNRLHRPLDASLDELVAIIGDVVGRRGGNVVVPAFALGRAQELLVLLIRLRGAGRLPPLAVYVDSPMAGRVTAITAAHPEFLDEEARAMLSQRAPLPPGFELGFTESAEESAGLARNARGAVIVAASGMCEAGRVRQHLMHALPRADCAVVFVGFQAEGTLGRRLVDGARQVRVLGRDLEVRAAIHTIGGLSAHADRDALLGWLRGFRRPPERCFVVHGEGSTATGFAATLRATLGWQAEAPQAGQAFDV